MEFWSCFAEKEELISETARELKATNTNDIARRASALSEELKTARHDIEILNGRIASMQIKSMLSDAVDVGPRKGYNQANEWLFN